MRSLSLSGAYPEDASAFHSSRGKVKSLLSTLNEANTVWRTIAVGVQET